MATFKIKKNSGNQYYWILKSDKNHKIIAKCSEYHPSKISAKNSIEWVKKNASLAKTVDETN